jgi:hypothetical protein
VGAQGSGLNKLREQLNVKVDISDDFDDKDKETSKKKKSSTQQKSKITVSENVNSSYSN